MMLDSLLKSFLQELNDPEWVYVGIANLQNFQSPAALLDFGDGITVRHRIFKELRRTLRWNRTECARFAQDGNEIGAGPNVLHVEHRLPKSPATLMPDTPFELATK